MKGIFILLIFWVMPVFAKPIYAKPVYARNTQSVSNRLIYNTSSKGSPSLFSGDMRFRYQHGLEGLETNNSGYFIRVRGGFKGKVSESLGWNFRMASGGWMDPSRDQRLGGFGAKPLWFDLASVSYAPVENFNFKIGKMNNPYFDKQKYNLIWDRDLKPEGISAHYTMYFLNKYKVDFDFSSFLRDTVMKGADRCLCNGGEDESEESFKLDDSFSYDKFLVAGSTRFLMSYDNYDFRTGISFYGIQSKGDWTGKDSKEPISNSTMSEDNQKYLYNYSILDIFFQMYLKNLWMPLSMSVQLIQNFSVKDASMGVVVGGILGDKRKIDSWSVGYSFFRLEKDATLAKYTNSDIGGNGVNYSGHEVNFNYLVNPSTQLGLKYIFRKDKNDLSDKINHALFGSLTLKI